MTFLWAEIEFGFNAITFRYYNDLFWYCYSISGIPIEFAIGFYKMYA